MDSRGDPVLCRQLEPARAEDSMSRIGGGVDSTRLQTTSTARLRLANATPDPLCSLTLQVEAWRRGHHITPAHTATAEPLPLIQVLLPHLRVSRGA